MRLENIDFLKAQIPDNSIDCIITDPPYGVEFKGGGYDDSYKNVSNLCDKWLKRCYDVLKEHSHIYIFIPTLEVDMWVSSVKKYFNLYNLIATKVYNTNSVFDDRYNYQLQLVIYASKGTPRKFNKIDWIKRSESWLKDKRNKDSNLFTYNYPSFLNEFANTKANKYVKRYHPNQKNHNLIQKFIEISTNEEEIVLDPFMGSGLTLIASINSRRYFMGFETNRKHFLNIFKRLDK